MSTTDTWVTGLAGALPTVAALAAWHRAGKAEKAAQEAARAIKQSRETR
jgi:hypothetical protein